MKKRSELNNDELSIIIFFECAAVDYGGKVDTRRMNELDFSIAKKWHADGFIRFERIAFHSLTSDNKTYAVFLSENAWKIAYQERRARNARINQKRSWLTISEKAEKE